MTAPANCQVCCPAGWSPNVDQVPDEWCPEHGRKRVDPLTVTIIRAFNYGIPGIAQMDDQTLVDTFGQAAQPLADGIRTAIREEMER